MPDNVERAGGGNRPRWVTSASAVASRPRLRRSGARKVGGIVVLGRRFRRVRGVASGPRGSATRLCRGDGRLANDRE